MPLNRLVAFVLGPAITLASGYISLWLSRHFPGAHLPDQKSIAGVLTTGVITVVPMILAHAKVQKWLDGWQGWEKRMDDATNGALDGALQTFLERVADKTGVPLPSDEPGPQTAAGSWMTEETRSRLAPADTTDEELTAEESPPPAADPGAFPPADRP